MTDAASPTDRFAGTVRYLFDHLHLNDWTVHLFEECSRHCEFPDSGAHIKVHYDRSSASLFLHTDSDPGEPWERIILHEMLHIYTNDIQSIAADAGVFEKAPEYRNLIFERTERLTHHLERILWLLLFPDGAPLDTPEKPP